MVAYITRLQCCWRQQRQLLRALGTRACVSASARADAPSCSNTPHGTASTAAAAAGAHRHRRPPRRARAWRCSPAPHTRAGSGRCRERAPHAQRRRRRLGCDRGGICGRSAAGSDCFAHSQRSSSQALRDCVSNDRWKRRAVVAIGVEGHCEAAPPERLTCDARSLSEIRASDAQLGGAVAWRRAGADGPDQRLLDAAERGGAEGAAMRAPLARDRHA